MKRTLLLVLVTFMSLAPAGCGGSTPTSPTGTVVVSGDVARGTGTVQFITVEGGFFAIRGDDGVVYDPRNLPAAFQKDGMRVRFEARVRNDMGSFHMVGPIVDVISISAL